MRRRQKIPPVQIENLYGMQVVDHCVKQKSICECEDGGGGWLANKQNRYAQPMRRKQKSRSCSNQKLEWDENCRPVAPKPSRMLVTESGGGRGTDKQNYYG